MSILKLSSLTAEQIEVWDKRYAAIHEAAHITVAIAEGFRCRAHIERRNVEDPFTDNVWIGSASIWPGMSSPQFGFAGAIGEVIIDDVSLDAEDQVGFLVDLLDLDELSLSQSDRDTLPSSRMEQILVIERTVATLNTHREFWQWAIDRLLDSEMVTDGETWDRFHGISYA